LGRSVVVALVETIEAQYLKKTAPDPKTILIKPHLLVCTSSINPLIEEVKMEAERSN
jgi:hypothetical protein